MRVTRAQAAANRERILKVAGTLFREHGFDGVGVAGIMKQAGLTHGGFYGHFASKEDLAAEMTRRILAGSGWPERVGDNGAASIGDAVREYLSPRHRDDAGHGCLFAALGADVIRQPWSVRRAFTEGLSRRIEMLQRLLPGRAAARRRQALATMAGLVGAIILSRAVDDPGLSDEILDATTVALTRREQGSRWERTRHMPNAQPKRCTWVNADQVLMREYHDREWGVPTHDDRVHFEFLILEAAQAGLSWSIVLNKRTGYRRAFSQFDPEKVARYSEARIDRLTADPGIIRNRMKIAAAVKNARAFLAVREEYGSFDAYCWQFVDGRSRQNRWTTLRQIPATTPESDAFSKDLKRRGFSFVGSTVIYAHMQAVGMVNDHLVDCFRYRDVRRLGMAADPTSGKSERPSSSRSSRNG